MISVLVLKNLRDLFLYTDRKRSDSAIVKSVRQFVEP